jgi:DNA-binding transcriptional MerR regulator/effector-binding domain-containing protein
MFKIGEFSQLGQVSPRMLRHYDKLGLLVPKHNDAWTGYRYYTIDQLAQLHRIIALKDLGLTLAQIGELLAGEETLPADQLRGMLRLKQNELRRELAEGMWRLQSVQARLQELEAAEQPSPYEIVVKTMAPQPAATIRMVVPHVTEMSFYCQHLFAQLYAELGRRGIRPVQPEIVLYHSREYRETDLPVEAALGVDAAHWAPAEPDSPLGFRQLPGHEMVASLIYEGPYANLTAAVLALLGWIGRQGHTVAGPLREIHLSGPAHGNEADEGEPVTELLVPIQRAAPSELRPAP